LRQDIPDVGPVRVLVVEDEVIIAMSLEDMLVDLGCSVVGPATNLDQAHLLAATADFDVALLDVNLDGERSEPIAEVLTQRAIPYALITGYGAAAIEGDGSAPPILSKPCSPGSLAALLRQLERR
jgi:CheY-like chemotaxis protein